jgi:hypothetical protein
MKFISVVRAVNGEIMAAGSSLIHVSLLLFLSQLFILNKQRLAQLFAQSSIIFNEIIKNLYIQNG